MTPAAIGVDWGTSNLRGWAFDADGGILAHATRPSGISAVIDGDFAAVLHDLVGGWTNGSVPIVLGGMIGSRQGWHEAPYLPCPASPHALAAKALQFDTGLGTGWIVPGLSWTSAAGVADVMRGEEVQLLGAGVDDGTVIMPGTHSKWVRLEAGRIQAFRTFMTGELFAILRSHSLLGRLMTDGPADQDAFDAGVDLGLADGAITALLFGVRTEGLFGRIAPHALADYLSGLLIGAELRAGAATARDDRIVIGDDRLTARYQRAFARAGMSPARIVPGDASAARGLWRLAKTIREQA